MSHEFGLARLVRSCSAIQKMNIDLPDGSTFPSGLPSAEPFEVAAVRVHFNIPPL